MDSNYVMLADIPKYWGLNKGDVVLLSSDCLRLSVSCHKNKEVFDPNILIDSIIDVLGENGTLLIPTYNWDFCHGLMFDYHKSLSQTGGLGRIALGRSDFKRTRHPIYSFAVWGKDQEYLFRMNNEDSFGSDSPFAYLEHKNAKQVIIDVSYNHCFTFTHYIEQKIGVPYRFVKVFTSQYKDEEGIVKEKAYSMYVRYLELNVISDMSEMAKDMLREGSTKHIIINEIEYKVVDLKATGKLIESDILYNKSKKIAQYVGQNE